MNAGKQARLVNGWRAISPDKEWSEGRFPAERRWKKHTGLPASANQWTDAALVLSGRLSQTPSPLTRSSLIRTESQST